MIFDPLHATQDQAIAAIMARRTGGSGTAVFVDPVILRQILEPFLAAALAEVERLTVLVKRIAMPQRLLTMTLTLLIASIRYQLAKERFETAGGVVDLSVNAAKRALLRVLDSATHLTIEASGSTQKPQS